MISDHSRFPDSTPCRVWAFHDAFRSLCLGGAGDCPQGFLLLKEGRCAGGILLASSSSIFPSGWRILEKWWGRKVKLWDMQASSSLYSILVNLNLVLFASLAF